MKKKLQKIILLPLLVILLSLPSWAGPEEDIQAGNQAAQKGNLKKAIELYNRALDSDNLSKTNRAVALTNLASALDDLGYTDEAINHYNLACANAPDYDPAYYNRSFAFEKKGLLNLALKDALKAANLKPLDSDYRSRLHYLRHIANRPKP